MCNMDGPRESDIIEVDEDEFETSQAVAPEEDLLGRLNRLTQMALDVYEGQMRSGTPAQKLEASSSVLKNATALIKALKQPNQSGGALLSADGEDGSFFQFDFAKSPEKAQEFMETFSQAFHVGDDDDEYRVSAPVPEEGDEE